MSSDSEAEAQPSIITGILNSSNQKLKSIFEKDRKFKCEIAAFKDIENKEENFQHFLDIAKYTDLNDPLFKELVKGIYDLTRKSYEPEIDPENPKVSPFATIVGPVIMGKTQFAFSLARVCPVFYVTMRYSFGMQYIYTVFHSISNAFLKCLMDDVKVLEKQIKSLDSDKILSNASDIKLKTIGLLWKLVKYSIKFNGFDQSEASGSDWFSYYNKQRNIKCEKMTVSTYLQNLKALVNDLANQGKEFKIPIVFMERFQLDEQKKIKLLRNLCRILALPCVLVSPHSGVNYLLDDNVTNGSDEVWVYTIRKLPKANIKAVLNVLDWGKYLNVPNSFDTKLLLEDLDVEADNTNLNQLDKLIKLMMAQSETCLQGIPLVIFEALKTKLGDFKDKKEELNTHAVWEHVIKYLRLKIFNFKSEIYSNEGQYLSRSMMLNHTILGDHEAKRISTKKPIHTIRNHYYYFGKQDDPVIVPFKYNGESLVHDGRKFESHFGTFKNDMFLCMALWSKYKTPTTEDNDDYDNNSTSVAVKLCHYLSNLVNDIKYNLPSNDRSCIQDSLILWALCKSTHNKLGSLDLGRKFLKSFIQNIQIDRYNAKNSPVFKNLEITNGYFDFPSKPNSILERFFANIKIPFLIPNGCITDDIRNNLEGLCQFGNCIHLAGNKLVFDLFYKKELKNGYIDYSRIDGNLSESDVLDYINLEDHTRYPISILIANSLSRGLKTRNYFDKNSNSNSKKAKLDPITNEEEPKESEGIAIYSACYKTSKSWDAWYNPGQLFLQIVPLVKFDKPTSVLIIIETNFLIPKTK